MLKAGEFARLCRTTKETLRHYEDIGLLAPAARADNGYKLYSLIQLADFLFISSLRGAGLSLGKIKGLLADPVGLHLREAIEDQVGAIDEQIRALERKKAVLEGTLEHDAAWRAWFSEEEAGVHRSPSGYLWRVQEAEEEHFVDSPTPIDDEMTGFSDAIVEHLEFCHRHGFGERFQGTYRVREDCVATGAYARGFSICTPIPLHVDAPRLHVKPAGTYVRWLNRIDVAALKGDPDAENPMFVAYDALRDFAREQGWRIMGSIYDTEYSLYCTGAECDCLYTEVSARIG